MRGTKRLSAQEQAEEDRWFATYGQSPHLWESIQGIKRQAKEMNDLEDLEWCKEMERRIINAR